MTVGYNMIILLAGMQGINSVYYEAAAIDGASEITQFFKITVPMLTPTVFFVMITSIISGFQVFDTVYMMIGQKQVRHSRQHRPLWHCFTGQRSTMVIKDMQQLFLF